MISDLLTDIGLQISGAGQELGGAGELVQGNVGKPLARQPGRGGAPGRVHHRQVGADLVLQLCVINKTQYLRLRLV